MERGRRRHLTLYLGLFMCKDRPEETLAVESFWSPLGGNLTLGQDTEVSSGSIVTLGYNKEVGFRQEFDFGLGQGSGFRYLGHPDKPLETLIMGLCLLSCLFLDYLCLLSCLFLNLELTLLLACN